MRTVANVSVAVLVVALLAGAAWAQGAGPTEAPTGASAAAGGSPWYGRAISQLGASLGAGVIVIGGSISIGRIASKSVESIARQPEAAGQMFLAWLLPAAMIEGVTLFGVVLCLLVITRA